MMTKIRRAAMDVTLPAKKKLDGLARGLPQFVLRIAEMEF